MFIDSNDIRIKKTNALPVLEQTAKTSRVGSVFADICAEAGAGAACAGSAFRRALRCHNGNGVG